MIIVDLYLDYSGFGQVLAVPAVLCFKFLTPRNVTTSKTISPDDGASKSVSYLINDCLKFVNFLALN